MKVRGAGGGRYPRPGGAGCDWQRIRGRRDECDGLQIRGLHTVEGPIVAAKGPGAIDAHGKFLMRVFHEVDMAVHVEDIATSWNMAEIGRVRSDVVPHDRHVALGPGRGARVVYVRDQEALNTFAVD